MSYPDPHPGLVIRYAYLWKREHEEGREDGSKDRPCAIVLSITEEDREREVLVLLITRTPPEHANDAERSWIVATEANEFTWPGPDLRAIAGRDASTIAYGTLPPKFFVYVRDKFLERIERD